jgi:hypothetical protein
MINPGTYRGIVKTGRGGEVKEMSETGTIDDIRRLTGLKVIPGTLNLDLTAPLDLRLLK